MNWDLPRPQAGVTIEKLTNCGAIPVGQGRDVVGLFSSLVRQAYPVGETP